MLAYMESPASSLRVADLDTATIERMIIEMGGDPSLDREPGSQPEVQAVHSQSTPQIQVPKVQHLDQPQINPPHPDLPFPSKSAKSSLTEEEQTNTSIDEKEQDQPNKSASFKQIQRNTFIRHPIQWARKESTQTRSQSGEELRHKPG